MYLRENIMLAINGLRANKMRALLTMLGIIIGISSVIAIVTIGQAMTGSVTAMLNDMGANNITIQISDKVDEYGNRDYSHEWDENDRITDDMIKEYMLAFQDQVAIYATSVSVGSGQVMNGRNQANVDVQGTNAGAIKIQNIDILAGHFLNEREVGGGKNVCVISDTFVKKLFPGLTLQQALGQEIKVRLAQGTYTLAIVGVYHYEVTGMMAGMAGDTSTMCFIPNPVARRIIGQNENEGYYYLQVKGSEQVTDSEAFGEKTAEFFNKRFFRDNKYTEVMAYSMDSMISQSTSMMNTMSVAISVIAGISLLVGGIGVMNIMLVSVTERTREIGTRKALGAKNSAIRAQFIVESMIICAIGGMIGVGLGSSVGYLGSQALGFATWPTISIIVIAVAFSMAIGVFFGYYPANKAAKLDPIEALRYE